MICSIAIPCRLRCSKTNLIILGIGEKYRILEYFQPFMYPSLHPTVKCDESSTREIV